MRSANVAASILLIAIAGCVSPSAQIATERGDKSMVEPVDCFSGWLEDKDCFVWGNLFNSPWKELAKGMSDKASEYGLTQEAKEPYLIWKKNGQENCRWVFVNDPLDIRSIREIYNSEANAGAPACYIVFKQVQMSPDAKRYDTRGDVIFDIFQMRPRQSYLWHHNRVYTPPSK